MELLFSLPTNREETSCLLTLALGPSGPRQTVQHLKITTEFHTSPPFYATSRDYISIIT